MQSASQRSYFWDALPSDLHWMSYFYINDTCLFGNMDPDILKLISLCGTLKLPVCAFLKCNMHFEIFKWPKLRLQLSFKNLTSGWLYSNNCHFFLPKNYTLFSKIVAEFLTALFWMIFCNYSQHLSTWWPSFFALVHFCMFLQKLKKIARSASILGSAVLKCPLNPSLTLLRQLLQSCSTLSEEGEKFWLKWVVSFCELGSLTWSGSNDARFDTKRYLGLESSQGEVGWDE